MSCKRKQDLRELDSNQILAKYPVTCYNGMHDSSEVGIDCGGPCAPCNVITPSCTPLTNSLKVGATNYSTTGSSCTASGSEYNMIGSYSGGSYTISLGNSTPDQSIAYTITTSVPGSNEATVHLNDSWLGGMDLSTGSVYISLVSGSYVATICNGSTYSWVSLQTVTVSGKVTCP